MCVKAELISTRLLSAEDKQDMLDGLIPIESLVLHVKVWIANGMPERTNGTGVLYKPEPEFPMRTYRGNGNR